jgi:hypothetical protein
MRKTLSTTETKSSDDSLVSKRTNEIFTFLSTTASIITIGFGGTFYIIGNAINPLKKDIAKIEEELKQLSNDNKIAMKEMSDDNKIAMKEMSDDNKIAMKKMDEVYFQVLKSNERLAVVETKQTLKG